MISPPATDVPSRGPVQPSAMQRRPGKTCTSPQSWPASPGTGAQRGPLTQMEPQGPAGPPARPQVLQQQLSHRLPTDFALVSCLESAPYPTSSRGPLLAGLTLCVGRAAASQTLGPAEAAGPLPAKCCSQGSESGMGTRSPPGGSRAVHDVTAERTPTGPAEHLKAWGPASALWRTVTQKSPVKDAC